MHNPALMDQAGVRHNSGKDLTTAMAAGAAAGRNVPPGIHLSNLTGMNWY